MKWSSILGLLGFSVMLCGENLLPDASFELGGPNYGKMRFFTGVSPRDCANVPPAEDTSEFVHGTRSLRFDSAGNAAVTNLRTPEFRLEKVQPYTLSFFAKANAGTEVRLQLLSIQKKPDGGPRRSWDNTSCRKFKLSPQWKRYTITFSPKAAYHQYYLADFSWKNAPNVSVWLDALQVEPGKTATPFAPAADTEFALYGTKRLQIGRNNSIQYELRAVNYTGNPVPVKIRLSGKEYYFNRAMSENVIQMTLPPNSRSVKKLSTDVQTPFGVYEINALAQTGKKQVPLWPFHYAVTGKYTPGAFNADRDFGVGVEESFSMNYPDLNGGKPYFQLMEGERFNDYLAIRKNEGHRVARFGNGRRFLEWKIVEKAPGKFDFTEADGFVDAVRASKAEILGVLGNLMSERMTPDWVVKRSTFSKKGRLHNEKTCFPPMEDFRRYVRETVSHFKGKIRYWEVYNEPNLNADAKEYLPYLKTAFEEIRKIDPEIRVVAPCTTGDLGGQMGEFLDQFGALGGFAYCDIVSFHPYSSPAEESPYPAPRAIQDMHRILAKYGCKAPLWNTELYYILNWKGNGQRDGIEVSKARARDFLARLCIDLGEGVKQSILLPSESSFRQETHPNYDYLVQRVVDQRIPNDIYVAGNAFARILEGAVPFTKLKTPHGITIYIYRMKNGNGAAAMWNFTKEKKFFFVRNDTELLKLTDVFGNENAWQEKLPLSSDFWFVTGNLSPEKLADTLRKARIQSEYPTGITFARYAAVPGSGPQLSVTLRNHTGQSQTARVRLLENTVFKPVFPGASTVEIPAENTVVLQIPIQLKSKIAPDVDAELLLLDGKTARKVSVKVESARFLRYGQSVTLSGKGGFQGIFRVESAKDAFRLTVTVKDAFRSKRGAHPYLDDCVELFFDRAPLAQPEKRQYTPEVFRLFLRPSAAGKPAVIDRTGNVDLSSLTWSVRDLSDGYEAKLDIPWPLLNVKQGEPVLFDLAIDNAASPGKAREQLIWSSGTHAHLYRNRFGIIY